MKCTRGYGIWVTYFVRLLFEELLIDLCEVAGLKGIQRRGPIEEGPKSRKKFATLDDGFTDRPDLAR